jgi:stearoyl-CoA desaturase (Delta-9 desaturase)
VIWALEKLGWVDDVRWPVRERIQSKLVVNQA